MTKSEWRNPKETRMTKTEIRPSCSDGDLADCQSATQQTASLRYGFGILSDFVIRDSDF